MCEDFDGAEAKRFCDSCIEEELYLGIDVCTEVNPELEEDSKKNIRRKAYEHDIENGKGFKAVSYADRYPQFSEEDRIKARERMSQYFEEMGSEDFAQLAREEIAALSS